MALAALSAEILVPLVALVMVTVASPVLAERNKQMIADRSKGPILSTPRVIQGIARKQTGAKRNVFSSCFKWVYLPDYA
jgi:hypothetical protein